MADTPKLSNDCFALPQGVAWTPVAEALDHLRNAVKIVVGTETISTTDAGGRILAVDAIANRSNPPYANAAVDGYGFAFAGLTSGDQALPLVDGRSAAGEPFDGVVPHGHAIRILTGARIPQGVDTVIMQEDVNIADDTLHFRGGLKAGANCREAGEDVLQGQPALLNGRKIAAQDIALLAALNIPTLTVFKRLRVGVLSTGDEIRQLGEAAEPHQIYDANRPMLLEILRKWGLEAVDLGHAKDSRTAVISALDAGARCCDAILTSGGASAGDEDHLSAVLNENGSLNLWRIAIKPGRPLALGMWQNVPVFGLPGNPVAAFVTTLIFARPALLKMQGVGWKLPLPIMLPAGFSKSKKAGRREYLRARMTDAGTIEKFQSEGSGRISGLTWSDGLVEFPDAAGEISQGDLVRYFPFERFGL
ncbi:MAG: molybdopterin molybdenumtransferase MoeA [Rhodobacteraceae bacterium]|nr:molybdopterin molybdenumtransferase MoeA [Paracoccaceae bacterium]